MVKPTSAPKAVNPFDQILAMMEKMTSAELSQLNAAREERAKQKIQAELAPKKLELQDQWDAIQDLLSQIKHMDPDFTAPWETSTARVDLQLAKLIKTQPSQSATLDALRQQSGLDDETLNKALQSKIFIVTGEVVTLKPRKGSGPSKV